MKCPNCKAKLSSKSKFCSQCGKLIEQPQHIHTTQTAEIVKGKLLGSAITGGESGGRDIAATQTVGTVEEDGQVVGVVIDSQSAEGGARQTLLGNIHIDHQGGVLGMGGQVNITHTQGASAMEMAHAFDYLRQSLMTIPDGPDKKLVQEAIEDMEGEAQKGEQADEKLVHDRFQTLAKMAPDIWEVAIDTFINPVKGLSTVFRKIAERARQEGSPS